MPTTISETALARRARLIFLGTVLRLNAATIREIEDKRRTVVARLDEIEKGPPMMAAHVGREITVKLATGEKARAGERVRFFANGWIFGESIAVESVGHTRLEPSRMTRVTAAASRHDAPSVKRRFETSDLEERLDGADVVVRGRVLGGQLPGSARAVARAAAAESAPARPISEHDPEWRDAIVQVESVDKGAPRKNQIVVRFPASDDVRWHRAPKFTPGQEGTFILRRAAPPARAGRAVRGVRALAAAAEGDAEAFTALHPDDFQPLDLAQDVRALTQTAKPSTRMKTSRRSASMKTAKPRKRK